MAYTAEISRTNPSCFLFLIDQSGSMQDSFGSGESTQTKADEVANVINRLLQNLVIKCAKSEGVRDYYHVGVIGYGTQVAPAFGGILAGRELVPISEIAANPASIEERTKKVSDGAGGLVDQSIRFPIWFSPLSNGGTPMCQSLNQAHTIISSWVSQHQNCFPPVVINITDGESTDGDPTSAAETIRKLEVSDGNVLLFNVHLSSTRASAIEFPDPQTRLPDSHAELLFRISSELPPYMRTIAQQEGYPALEGSRGFAFNADLVGLIKFLDIGTRPSNLR